MLGECREHGGFRAEACPTCGQKGRFLMNDHELNRVGRIMAGILRHFPDRFNLDMDRRGWVDLEQMVSSIRDSKERLHWLRPYHVGAIVATDPKGRYQIEEGRVRATYAHSLDLELDDLPLANADELYYPVTEEELDIVLETGLKPSDRKKIHLSATMDKAYQAGRVRTEKPTVLRIDARGAQESGTVIRRAGKAVYVSDSIEPRFLSVVEDIENKIDVAALASEEEQA